ncbi:MAG TPA: hypothetical protein VFP28_03925 [Gemmatimonadales bacterium]|nr:hypothetical protein [Gemmatimonadales bacterium]
MSTARGRLVLIGALSLLLSCGEGGGFEPRLQPYYTLLRDGPCDGPTPPTDTLMQPHGLPPNAGTGYIGSTGPEDRPPRTVFTVLGYSRNGVSVGELIFILLRVPNPPPAGTYALEDVADSTAWLEDYLPPYRMDDVPFDMTEDGFVVAPFVGSVHIEASDSSGVVGTLIVQGSYRYDGVLRCMWASGRFSTRFR